MPPPVRLSYQYKQTSVIAEWPTSHAKALEIAHRDFVELRDVEDERIHFCMFIKRHSSTEKMSRISPAIWVTFFGSFESKPDRGLLIMYLEVDKPRKLTWREKLGLNKEEKKPAKEEEPAKADKKAEDGKEDNQDIATGKETELPAYSKGMA